MTGALRVLYLAPPARNPEQLSRYTFLDEEIRALAETGLEAFVLGPTGGGDHDVGRIHVRGVPAEDPARRLRVTQFALQHLRHIPVRNLMAVRHCYSAARIECFASELITRERIDLVHSYFAWPRGYGGLLARAATGRPLVAHLRGNDINTHRSIGYGARLNPPFDRAVRRLLQDADTTVFVSDFLKRRGCALGAPVTSARVIMQGVRPDVFRPARDKGALRRELGVDSGPVLLVVAGLIPIKGVHLILESLALLRDVCHFSLVICGDGPQRIALEETAVRVGIATRTTFVGRIPRAAIPQYFEMADIFLHGSLVESAGYALLEAMAAGLPIVCTDSGGPAEYVKDGVAGFVVPVENPKAMAEKISLLLRDESLRQALGRCGRHNVETLFSYDRMIQETVATYLEMVPAKG